MDVAVVLVAMAPVKISFENKEHDEAEQHNKEDTVTFAVFESLRYEVEESPADQRTGGKTDHENQYPVHEPFVQQQAENAYQRNGTDNDAGPHRPIEIHGIPTSPLLFLFSVSNAFCGFYSGRWLKISLDPFLDLNKGSDGKK